MAWSETWTYVDGEWVDGNTPIFGARTHGVWQGSSVFDGGRVLEGTTPDIEKHFARVNRSAAAMGLEAVTAVDEMQQLLQDGRKRFAPGTALYVRPMYWPEQGGYFGVMPDGASTRFCLCLYETPMPDPDGFSITLSPFRKPTQASAVTDAKAGCLYPNNGRAIREAQTRGFDNAIMLDPEGNVAETATSNIFIVKDGVAATPVANGLFLAGITRARVAALLRAAGTDVQERPVAWEDVRDADEVFSTGNYAKVIPINRVEERSLQPGPVFRRARELYWDYAHSR